jgi:hypothetical protein
MVFKMLQVNNLGHVSFSHLTGGREGVVLASSLVAGNKHEVKLKDDETAEVNHKQAPIRSLTCFLVQAFVRKFSKGFEIHRSFISVYVLEAQ